MSNAGLSRWKTAQCLTFDFCYSKSLRKVDPIVLYGLSHCSPIFIKQIATNVPNN